jgi:hypothetical protein
MMPGLSNPMGITNRPAMLLCKVPWNQKHATVEYGCERYCEVFSRITKRPILSLVCNEIWLKLIMNVHMILINRWRRVTITHRSHPWAVDVSESVSSLDKYFRGTEEGVYVRDYTNGAPCPPLVNSCSASHVVNGCVQPDISKS